MSNKMTKEQKAHAIAIAPSKLSNAENFRFVTSKKTGRLYLKWDNTNLGALDQPTGQILAQNMGMIGIF